MHKYNILNNRFKIESIKLKININELENLIKEKELIKKKYVSKTEILRKFAITNTFLAFGCHVSAFIIHPSLLFGALTFMLLGVMPEGFILFHREDVEEKYNKEIEGLKEELNKMQDELKNNLNTTQNSLEPLENTIDKIKIENLNPKIKKETITSKKTRR